MSALEQDAVQRSLAYQEARQAEQCSTPEQDRKALLVIVGIAGLLALTAGLALWFLAGLR